MSLPGRLANVYAAPGEVFDEVKRGPFNAVNWVAPALVLIIVSWVCSWIVFRQPAVEQQLREVASQAIEKQLSKGKVSQEQADQARAIGEKWAVIGSKISAAVAPPVVGFGMPFVWGVVVWLVGTRALKGQFAYMKAVEVSALAGMIGVLDSIVRSLLIILTGNLFAAASPVVFIKDYDPQTFSHAILGVFNLIALWALWVRSVGLAKLSGSGTGRAAAWIFGLWLAYTLVTLGAGFGVQALTNR